MKKSSRIKQILSVALVSVLAATVMPSTASADPEYINYDDVVTVEVDLGGGPGEEVGCEGMSTLELPDNTLRARLDSRQPGVPNPDILDLLLWYWGSGYSILPFGDLGPEPTQFTNSDLNSYMGYLEAIGVSPVRYVGDVATPGATVSNLTSISYDFETQNYGYLEIDTDQDGIIEGADAPDFLTETKRVYSSDVFEVSYEATDCVDSSDIGVLYATRGYVQRLLVGDNNISGWAPAEADWFDNSSSVNRGQAYLRGNLSALGGFISIPAKVAMEPEVTDEPVGEVYDIYDWDPISLGGAGSVEMRAVMKIFGASPTGKYRTQFYYQLITGEENFLTCEILDYCG
jgi:hypothetical protein